MHFPKHLSAFFLLLMLTLIMGCSGESTPVTTDDKPNSIESLPVINLAQSGDTYNAIGLLGAYELTIDPDESNVYLIPKRTSSIGESYVVSGIGFFTVSPCSDCLKLTGFSFDMTELVLSFSIDHPFTKGNLSEPPSAVNRRDLDVFDAAAVIHPKDTTPASFAMMGTEIYDNVCINPSGYTRELENVIGDTAVLPYFLVIDDSTEHDPSVSTNNRFEMGSSDSFDITFNLSAGSLIYDLYLTMSYGSSARKAQRLTPKYYLPEFNRKSAWKVNVIPPGPCEIGSTWKNNDTTTEYDVTVEVYDWQVNAAISTNDPYDDEPDTTKVWASSEVYEIYAFVAGMTSYIPSEMTADSGSGAPDDPLIYKISFPNEMGLTPGEYPGLVCVEDVRTPGAIGDRDFGIDSPDGINLINFALTQFSTYQTFTACVVYGCGPITGWVDYPSCPIDGLPTGSVVAFQVTALSDNGGYPILLYEMCEDYDGVNFVVDDSNTSGFFGAGPFIPPDPCDDNIPYTWTVAFRAMDSCDPPNITIFATCDVTVESCCTDQILAWDWASCGLTYTCDGWQCGGCGLPNNDQLNWGSFNFGCNASDANGCTDIALEYITSGGDGLGCGFLWDHENNADFNVVSPSLSLPASTNGVVHFDHCNDFSSDATCTVYISTNDCSGPWTSLGTTSSSSGCHQDTTFDISDFEGSSVMFRIRYQAVTRELSGASCRNGGIVIDNFTIEGCFEGTLAEN